jgi:hypothetical protein
MVRSRRATDYTEVNKVGVCTDPLVSVSGGLLISRRVSDSRCDWAYCELAFLAA